MSASCAAALLRVTGLRTRFPIRSGAGSRATDFVRAVDGIDDLIQINQFVNFFLIIPPGGINDQCQRILWCCY